MSSFTVRQSIEAMEEYAVESGKNYPTHRALSF